MSVKERGGAGRGGGRTGREWKENEVEGGGDGTELKIAKL